MTGIFISHAVADKDLAEKFTAFLKEAIGVPNASIFCSSVNGNNIPLGEDFNEYMKDQIQDPELVILLMTPSYMESWFCLMELGATWVKSANAIPIVVPPVKFGVISNTLGLKQGWSINDSSKLVDLRKKIQSTNIELEERSEHDWDKKRATWKADLKKLLKNISPATSVSAADHEIVQNKLSELEKELFCLQAVYEERGELIEKLKAAKDSKEVKAIMSDINDTNPSETFDKLLKNISNLQPNFSTSFYRNMIMDHYRKSAGIDWYDPQQKLDAEAAIQYNFMESESPYDYLWNTKKLKSIKKAIIELDDFLMSDEASDYVEECENEGFSMDTDDLEFWEAHLN